MDYTNNKGLFVLNTISKIIKGFLVKILPFALKLL